MLDEAGSRASDTLAADYFDGRSSRAHLVRLSRCGNSLLITGDGIERSVVLADVRWPERTRHGARIAAIAGGGELHGRDAGTWDDWVRRQCRGDSVVVKAQQSWRWVGAGTLALVLLLGATYQWGAPWAARMVVAMLPSRADELLGDAALRSLDADLLRPSRLPGATQAKLSAAFERAAATLPAGSVAPHRVEFRRGRIGPNAFAVPGGTIVITDELVEMVKADPDTVTAVLAHELGHLRHRHGMRLLVQTAAIGAVASVVLGDVSSLVAAVPALIGAASYSRDAEREADAEALRLMRAAGVSPLVMVDFFDQVAHWREQTTANDGDGAPSWIGIAIASHPSDSERVRFFREAAAH